MASHSQWMIDALRYQWKAEQLPELAADEQQLKAARARRAEDGRPPERLAPFWQPKSSLRRRRRLECLERRGAA